MTQAAAIQTTQDNPPKPKSEATYRAETATLRLRSGAAVQTLDVGRGKSLLQIALEDDIPLTFVCCRGACGACLIRVSSHEQNLSPKTAVEQKLLTALEADPDERLACQCSILGDAEIEIVEPSTFS